MQMLSTISRIKTANAVKAQRRWIAVALPLAITVGCAKSDIIDYTISPAEYAALTIPAAPATENEPVLAAALPDVETNEGGLHDTAMLAKTDAPNSAQIVLASAPPKLPVPAEPVMPEALPDDAKIVMAEKATFASAAAAELANSKLEETVAALDAKVSALEATQLEALKPETKPEAETPVEPDLASAIDRAIDVNRFGFTPSIYATAGLGVSRASPDTSAAENFEPNDLTEPAGQAAFGVDVARFLSLEVHSADYGSTSLTPEGRINTHVNGVSALIYAGKKLDRFRRQGLNGYARIGFNQIENTPVGNIPFLERTTNQASFGVGAEYTTRFGIGFRADLVAYDGDVQYGQLGLLYRLASKPKIHPKLAVVTEKPASSESDIPELNAARPAMKKDLMANTDKPTVKETLEESLDISVPDYATEYGSNSGNDCSGLNGTLSNVTFMNGSAQLTFGAIQALNNVAVTLNDCTDRQIIVSAHTDNNGSAAENHGLSKRRARAVAVHLASQGVDKNRMRAVAFGESRPVASNATQEGRSRNRRVELQVR